MINIPIICISMLLVGFIIHSMQINTIKNVIKKEDNFTTKLLNLVIDSQEDIECLKVDIGNLMEEVFKLENSKIKQFTGENLDDIGRF